MFINTKTKAEIEIERKIKSLKGKNTSEKFLSLMAELKKVLSDVYNLNRFSDKELKINVKTVLDQYGDNNETTSNEEKLRLMVLCLNDLTNLLDDMLHDVDKGTYNIRLTKCVDFIRNFNSLNYEPHVNFYEEDTTKIQNQLRVIIRDIKYKIGKQVYDVEKYNLSIIELEKINIKLANDLRKLKETSLEYSVIAGEISSNDKLIKVKQSQSLPLKKNIESLRLISNLLDTILERDTQFNNLKKNGYIKKLVKKLYKNPAKLDIIENAIDITDVIETLNKEINEKYNLVDSIDARVFNENNLNVDSALVRKYQNMKKEDDK
jgi:hypothetical protein